MSLYGAMCWVGGDFVRVDAFFVGCGNCICSDWVHKLQTQTLKLLVLFISVMLLWDFLQLFQFWYWDYNTIR